MGFDLRVPIGALFTILGILLILYGVMSPAGIYEHSLGINVNLWGGGPWVVVGLICLAIPRGARRRGGARGRERPTTVGH